VLCGSSPQTCGPNWRVRTSRLLPTAPRSREALQKGHDCLPGPQIGGGGTRRVFGMAPHRRQSGRLGRPSISDESGPCGRTLPTRLCGAKITPGPASSPLVPIRR
jgi:hypothetical protein